MILPWLDLGKQVWYSISDVKHMGKCSHKWCWRCFPTDLLAPLFQQTLEEPTIFQVSRALVCRLQGVVEILWRNKWYHPDLLVLNLLQVPKALRHSKELFDCHPENVTTWSPYWLLRVLLFLPSITGVLCNPFIKLDILLISFSFCQFRAIAVFFSNNPHPN